MDTSVMPVPPRAQPEAPASPAAATSPAFEQLGLLYLGKTEDGAPYLLDSKHLTTHGVIVGMTGSGKTGLSVALLEEAAIDGLPAIVIDPKGDLANLLLTFPSLTAEAIGPWVAEGKDPAAEASAWKRGLEEWGQDEARIARLKASADFCVYTPGSSAGRQVSLLQSLEAPAGASDDAELLRERILAVASGLLGLVGIDADPIKSREHVLLSNILHAAWSKGKGLDLETLVKRVAEPGFTKVGVLDLESFYPSRERMELASTFNNLLASPGFASWLEGEPLDIASLMRAPGGKPRLAIFSISHLGDAERMFFVTLLLSQLVSWMRMQSGTTSLRALVYMDEIFGYFPPVANPPSKGPLLTLLKQARAFGLGVVLATQNPMDLDYKGLSNTGTWFVGRLQTDRDKARLAQGLTGSGGGTPIDGAALERLLSALEKRQFLVHDVHDPSGLKLIRTRSTLSYLRGPLTREHLKKLQPKEATAEKAQAARAESTPVDSAELPMVPKEVTQVFVGASPFTPKLLGVASVRIQDAKTKVDVTREVRFLFPFSEGAMPIHWDAGTWLRESVKDLATTAPEGSVGERLPDVALKAKSYAAWAKDYAAWLLHHQGVVRYKDPVTGSISAEGENESAFRGRLAQSHREERDLETEKLRKKYAPKFEALKTKIETESAAAAAARSEVSSAMAAQGVASGASMLAAVLGRGSAAGVARSIGSAARGAAAVKKKSASAETREARVRALQEKWRELDAAFRAEASAIGTSMNEAALEEIVLKPKKTGIRVSLMALAWVQKPATAGLPVPG